MRMSGAHSVFLLPVTALAVLAFTQTSTAQTPPPGNQFIACATPGQPLLRVPEFVSQNGVTRGTIVLSVENNRMKERAGNATNDCVLQFNRAYRGANATLPGYPGTIPAGYPGYIPPPPLSYAGYSDPMPGPTLRARVGDIVQLTFLNQIDTGVFGNSIDRGETRRLRRKVVIKAPAPTRMSTRTRTASTARAPAIFISTARIPTHRRPATMSSSRYGRRHAKRQASRHRRQRRTGVQTILRCL